MKNKKLLLGVSALMTAGVLAAGASSTAAWFIASKNVSIDVNNIGLEADTGVLKIKWEGQLTTTHEGVAAANKSTLNGEYGTKDSVSVATVKLNSCSSKDGSDIVVPDQDGTAMEFKAAATTDYFRFLVGIENWSLSKQTIKLNNSKCEVKKNTGDVAYKQVRVAIDTLIADTAPTAKGTTAVTFMSNSSALGKFVTADDTGTLTEDLDNWAVAPWAADTGNEHVATDLVKNIKTDTGAHELGDIAAATKSGDTITAKKAFAVVTVWYEGTEEVNQNAYMEHVFSISLGFTGENADD